MRIVVYGGHPLRGTFRPSGNSNAALALIAASLLTEAEVTLRGVPDTSTTALMLDAARALGAQITRDEAHTLRAPALHTRSLGPEITDGQVGAVLLLAPILARRRHARLEIDYPLSRLHTHLTALRDLGFDIHISGDVLDFSAFLGNAVSFSGGTAVAVTDGTADVFAGNNVVYINDLYANATDGLGFDANSKLVMIQDDGADTVISYVTTGAGGVVTSITDVATLVGVTGAVLDAAQVI